MGALELARAFGIDEVELPEPPGFGARLRLVEIDELLRSRTAPSDLRRSVIEQASKASVATSSDDAPLDPQLLELTSRMLDWQVAGMVRALRTAPDAEWEPVTMTPDVFAELPPRTQAALRDIAERKKTPAMVTALVRRMRGEITEEEALAVFEAERPKLVASWGSFRHERGGARAGSDSQAVEPQPVELPAGAGSGAGAGAGPGTGDPGHELGG